MSTIWDLHSSQSHTIVNYSYILERGNMQGPVLRQRPIEPSTSLIALVSRFQLLGISSFCLVGVAIVGARFTETGAVTEGFMSR